MLEVLVTSLTVIAVAVLPDSGDRDYHRPAAAYSLPYPWRVGQAESAWVAG